MSHTQNHLPDHTDAFISEFQVFAGVDSADAAAATNVEKEGMGENMIEGLDLHALLAPFNRFYKNACGVCV
jgi:hypothetical protein